MKSISTAALISLFAAPAFSLALIPRTDSSSYVYKDPFSYNGTCKSVVGSAGVCRSGKASWEIDIACLNSRCDDNTSPCIVAYAADGTEKAKCATNLVDYDWAWPYIDEDAKAKINAAGLRRHTVDTCMKIAQKDLDGAASDGAKVNAAQEVYKCFNDHVVMPAGKSGKDAETDASNLIKSVAACVKAADNTWSKSTTDTDKKTAAVALVACYDTVQWS